MATNLALARSFYSWMAKVSLSESGQIVDRLPKTYPTHPHGLKIVTEQVHEVLKGSAHEDRALYWRKIYEQYIDEGFCQRLEEGRYLSWVLNALATVFRPVTPPPPPPSEEEQSDNIIIDKLKQGIDFVKHELDQIEELRVRGYTYRGVEALLDDQEEAALFKAVNYTPEVSDYPDIRKTARYRHWCRSFAGTPFGFKFWRMIIQAAKNWVITVGIGIEYIVAFIRYVFGIIERIVKKAFGRDAVSRVFANVS